MVVEALGPRYLRAATHAAQTDLHRAADRLRGGPDAAWTTPSGAVVEPERCVDQWRFATEPTSKETALVPRERGGRSLKTEKV